MPSQDLVFRIKAVGTQQFARQMEEDAAAVGHLESKTKQANTAMRALGRTSTRASSGMRGFNTLAKRTAITLGGLGVGAVVVGLKFDAMLEQQRTAFTGFLGSTSAATKYLNQLYKLAAKTPFEFQDVLKGSRNLMAYGMSAKTAYGTLKDLGNAIAATGGGADEIGRTTTALGQIQAAGVLHAQDLNQLIQAGVVSLPKLSAAMGSNTKKFRSDMAAGRITSGKFFKALRTGWEHDPMYKGAATKQAKTFLGQLSTLHDYAVQTLGVITLPLFNALERDVLPKLTVLTQRLSAIWGGKGTFRRSSRCRARRSSRSSTSSATSGPRTTSVGASSVASRPP